MLSIKIKDETILKLIDAIQLPHESESKRNKNIVQSFVSKVGQYEDLLNKTINDILTKYPENYNHATKQIKLPLREIHRKSERIKINGNRHYIHALFVKHAPIMHIEYNNKNINKSNEYSHIFFLPTSTEMIGTMKTLAQTIADIYDSNGKIDINKLYTLNGDENDNSLFSRLFPDININDLLESTSRYDYLRVDIKSLTNYINWLNTVENMSDRKKYRILTVSSIILRISKLIPHYDEYSDKQFGLFPMLRNVKASGRTYYKGINIQNFEKNGLRKAVLGYHHEYDIKSCATVWKYHIGKDILPDYNFPVLEFTISNKKELFEDLVDELFYDVAWKRDYKIGIIKRIVNSIGFGAKFTAKRTYPIGNGKFERVALYDLFYSKKAPLLKEKCAELYDRCKDNWYFVKLIEEHNIIEKEIERIELLYNKDFKKNPLFKSDSENGRYSSSKFIAHLYQSFETDVMNNVRKLLNETNCYYLIANIHDAIVTSHAIDIQSINYEIKKITGYKYLELDHNIVDGWQKVINHAEIDRLEREHRAIIARETAKAKGYVSDICTTINIEPSININPFDKEHEAQVAWDLYWKRQEELEEL